MKQLVFFMFLAIAGCKKNKEYCWQVYDMLGNEAGIVCDKTEAEMTSQYGIYFDRQDAKKHCWKVQNSGGSFSYPENISEKMAGIFFQGVVSWVIIPCGYCQKWISREKGLYKPTGLSAYKPLRTEQYCGDTVATLFAGRIITIRETPDSLITVEFMQKL